MNIASLTFAGFIKEIISSIIQPITVLIFALSILYFLWNVTQFIRKSDDPKEIEKFKTNAMWGIVAIFVMASMWGLVRILINSFVPGAGIPNFDSGASSAGSDLLKLPTNSGIHLNMDNPERYPSTAGYFKSGVVPTTPVLNSPQSKPSVPSGWDSSPTINKIAPGGGVGPWDVYGGD